MVVRAAEALTATGLGVVIYVPEPGPFTDRLEQLGQDWRRLPFPVLRRTLLSPRGLVMLVRLFATSLPAIVRAVRQADVVYVNTVNCGSWILAARLLRVPVVCHVRENEPDMGRLQRSLLLAPLLLADIVLANSRSTRQWVLDAFPRLTARTRVLYNGLDLPEFPPDRLLHRSGCVRLVVVGRLSWRKGQDVAIRALGRLVAQGVDAELSLAGDHYPGYESYVDGLHALAAKLGLRERVHFLGFQSEVSTCWAEADIALVPSLVEPFGNVAVEAMAAGLPVVASDVQGLAEIVSDGRTGLLVPPSDEVALAGAVADLLRDPERTRCMARAAVVDVNHRFSLARYSADISAVLTAAADRS